MTSHDPRYVVLTVEDEEDHAALIPFRTRGTRGMRKEEEKVSVLVVEDDPDHATLIEAVFESREPKPAVRIMESAEAAVEYLLGKNGHPDREAHPLPDVIILDLALPGMGGIGFLEWREEAFSDPEWREVEQIPVVVFTSNNDPEMIWRCYSLGAREVRVKGGDFQELSTAVSRVLNRWLSW